MGMLTRPIRELLIRLKGLYWNSLPFGEFLWIRPIDPNMRMRKFAQQFPGGGGNPSGELILCSGRGS